MTRTSLPLLLLILLAPMWARAQSPRVTILSPQEGALLEGLTRVSVLPEPASAFASVIIFVDGRQICERSAPPYECEFDAGREIVSHQVRAVGSLKAGGRGVNHTIDTGDLQHSETSRVFAVEVSVLAMQGGRFIKGLPESAFRLYDEGRPQTITSFASEDTSLEVVAAIDVSASVGPVLPRIKEAVRAFLGALPANHPVTLLGFNGEIFTLTTRETDHAARIAAVDDLSAFGTTALYDVVVYGLDLLATRPGRKALVVFSDGEDRGSAATLDDVERRAQQTDAAIYTVGMGRGNEVADLMKVLARIADPTGGRTLQTNSIDRLRDTFREVVDELAHQYMLRFVPDGTAPAGEWRRIRVEAAGYRVRARAGYISPGK